MTLKFHFSDCFSICPSTAPVQAGRRCGSFVRAGTRTLHLARDRVRPVSPCARAHGCHLVLRVAQLLSCGCQRKQCRRRSERVPRRSRACLRAQTHTSRVLVAWAGTQMSRLLAALAVTASSVAAAVSAPSPSCLHLRGGQLTGSLMVPDEVGFILRAPSVRPEIPAC